MILLLIPVFFPIARSAVLPSPPVADPAPGCGVYHTNFTIAPKWEKLFSTGQNLTMFYKNPMCGYGYGHELVRTAMIYLEELEELEEDVETNRPLALDAAWELYLCGGPRHLNQIPYMEFVKLFNWNSDDVDEYFTLIHGTRRVWNNILEELQRTADPDLIV